MKKTRLSLFYLLGYTSVGGLGLLIAPQFAMKLFFAEGEYSDLMLRIMGMFLLGIALIVFRIIQLRAEALYSTTILVRVFFVICMAGFYLTYADPFLLVLLVVVLLGLVLTAVSYFKDGKA